MRKLLVLSLVMMIVVGCAERQNVGESPVNASFEGSWMISDFMERGTKTFKHDGKTATITKKGDLYFIDSPDWVFEEAKFRVVKGNLLVGETVQDYEGLKEIFSDTPDSAVRQAAASKTAVYRATLTMLRDGRLSCERSNGRIVYDGQGRFRNFEVHSGWIKFVLTRQWVKWSYAREQ